VNLNKKLFISLCFWHDSSSIIVLHANLYSNLPLSYLNRAFLIAPRDTCRLWSGFLNDMQMVLRIRVSDIISFHYPSTLPAIFRNVHKRKPHGRYTFPVLFVLVIKKFRVSIKFMYPAIKWSFLYGVFSRACSYSLCMQIDGMTMNF
jgi:hypothetical protein